MGHAWAPSWPDGPLFLQLVRNTPLTPLLL